MQPERTLKQISSELRLVAGVLIVLGSLFCLELVTRAFETQFIGVLGFLILLAPGTWFAVASFYVRHGNLPVVKWSLRIAAGQLLLAVFSVGLMVYFLASHGKPGTQPPVCMPAGLLLFFMPAEAVLVVRLFRARDIIRANETARGFDVEVAVDGDANLKARG
jgi:hypothetical protein